MFIQLSRLCSRPLVSRHLVTRSTYFVGIGPRCSQLQWRTHLVARPYSSQQQSHHNTSPPTQPQPPANPPTSEKKTLKTIRENIYTLPNLLTVSRILACPVLGWSIVEGNFVMATSLLVYAGLTDLADGFLARRYKMQSVLGTILDPAADKTLMTTLTITLAMKDMLPLPLAAIILGRDVLLSLAAFYIRYTSLPHPKTFSRYWDFSIPSAEVRPTQISKVNTALQLLLMGVTTISPLLPFEMGTSLLGLQWIVGATTVWSGASYVFSKNAVRVISQKKPPSP
ncbi:phosphatidyl synthase [Cristinia sonorae]|uniref:Phosphatidyl synthase n=1 Tax=Cristinia sonorae TaxID=1940300 RepID=A0A8K0UV71_9AGAR|nr:phosphatidyl synthase [Cristinia sonorae]